MKVLLVCGMDDRLSICIGCVGIVFLMLLLCLLSMVWM